MLPTDYQARKDLPLWDYMFGYFPDAWLAEVAVAISGNQQHNRGESLHWAREKSTDQLNTAFRHIFDHGQGTAKDTDGCYHLAKAIWRLKAELQLTIERERVKAAASRCMGTSWAGRNMGFVRCALPLGHIGACHYDPSPENANAR